MANNPIRKLWICWDLPSEPLPKDAIILSFLKPSIEYELIKKYPDQVISARQQAHEVRDHALNAYCQIVANIGTVSVGNGKTLRSVLKQDDLSSLWWFHKVPVKDLETDPMYDDMIHTLIINQILEQNQFVSIEVYGAQQKIIDVIGKKFQIISHKSKKESLSIHLIIAFLKRIKAFFLMIYDVIRIKGLKKKSVGAYDVLFSSFWDWSFIRQDGNTLRDRYYQSLPDKFQAQGKKIGWLLWLSHRYQQKENRAIKDVVKPLHDKDNCIIVQAFLHLGDIFLAFLNFKGLYYFFFAVRNESFRRIFAGNGLDLFPLFRNGLWLGFIDGGIPFYELVYKAHKRALEKNSATLLFSFMNLYPHARAVYAAANSVTNKPIVVDIQHASYSWETTIGRLDNDMEFKGKPEGCAIPHADYMCVMGELGREVFGSSGYTPDQIKMTGSSRYDYVFSPELDQMSFVNPRGNILIVTAMDLEAEMEMINAVFSAFEKEDSVHVQLRSHPFSSISSRKDFKPYQGKIKVTENTTLEEDLKWADIVLCSYSTVGEEAFIRGIPVWQWSSAGANASVFRAVQVVPVFSSVEQLKNLYKAYQENHKEFYPLEKDRNLIKEQCFYSQGGYPTDNIINFVTSLDVFKERILR